MKINYLSFSGEPQYECDLCGKFWVRLSYIFSVQEKLIIFHYKSQAKSIILKEAYILIREITWE